ncbi:hypothetical protein [Actinomadura sp. NBRC 104412]|uniref:hypothetical protein n=1 Tax=Actinomadura sp. NBRC 104412 TaxID=3032203 RepID=UPI00255294F6|nr:hypothetical protein [Actinomadura sp. NBRC 104412]
MIIFVALSLRPDGFRIMGDVCQKERGRLCVDQRFEDSAAGTAVARVQLGWLAWPDGSDGEK